MISISHVLGKNADQIDFDSFEVPLHRALLEPVLAMKQSAQKAGINLRICSGFRSFQQQQTIWNEKVAGKRAILDASGREIDCELLNNDEIVRAILRWSALPGCSRHHWGTDFDVLDGDVVDAGYRPQLVREEYEAGGVFSRLHHWLNGYLVENAGFFRPYTQAYEVGVEPEPWHLSFMPVASEYSSLLKIEQLRTAIEESEVALKENVLAHLDFIFTHYVAQYA